MKAEVVPLPQLTRDSRLQLLPLFLFLSSSDLLQAPGALLQYLVRFAGAGSRGTPRLHVVHLAVHPLHTGGDAFHVFEQHAVIVSQAVHGHGGQLFEILQLSVVAVELLMPKMYSILLDECRGGGGGTSVIDIAETNSSRTRRVCCGAKVLLQHQC